MKLTRRTAMLSTAAGLLAPNLQAPSAHAAPPPAWKLPTPGGVTIIENTWIPMPDGIRLSARLWLPQSSKTRPAPIVLEYIPYRKRDLYRRHDAAWGPELAKYGIGYARVDVRGSGDSEGVIIDEYAEPELHDGAEIIAWLARQPYSNGRIGMRGISWGGINTLQVAALAPPALKAIMPMCCTDTRYTDDAHYIGGAMGFTNLQWATQFKMVMAMPPDPAIAGPNWRQMWQQRLDATPDIVATWCRHQHNDAYWQRGSVSRNYAAITCPIFIVDGWTDTYINTVFRLLEGAKTPIKALIGPWAHTYPEGGTPGPALNWIAEEVRWWSHWLAQQETGIMAEPTLRSFMPSATAAEATTPDLPGHWVADPHWPSPYIAPKTWHLAPAKLGPTPGHGTLTYLADKIVGLEKLEWLPFPPEGLPGEQTPDDRKSLVFDTDPLPADIEILGFPTAHIRLSANRPVSYLALRLCRVDPDGKSWLITDGLLNLTQRDSNVTPKPLSPGTFYNVTLKLNAIAHRFTKGSKIRLALSESLWPLVWPSPEIVTLTVDLAHSRLDLPVRHAPAQEIPFDVPTLPPGAARTPGRAPLTVQGPDSTGTITIRQDPPHFSFTIPDTGTKLVNIGGMNEVLTAQEGHPNAGAWHLEAGSGFQRGDWNTRVHVTTSFTSTPTDFTVEERLEAFEDEKSVFRRSRKTIIARNLI
jgi:putative CocE/NonD family hydrolase